MFGHHVWRPATVALVLTGAIFLPQGVAAAATPDTVSCARLSSEARDSRPDCRPKGRDGIFVGPVAPAAKAKRSTSTGSTASSPAGATATASSTVGSTATVAPAATPTTAPAEPTGQDSTPTIEPAPGGTTTDPAPGGGTVGGSTGSGSVGTGSGGSGSSTRAPSHSSDDSDDSGDSASGSSDDSDDGDSDSSGSSSDSDDDSDDDSGSSSGSGSSGGGSSSSGSSGSSYSSGSGTISADVNASAAACTTNAGGTGAGSTTSTAPTAPTAPAATSGTGSTDTDVASVTRILSGLGLDPETMAKAVEALAATVGGSSAPASSSTAGPVASTGGAGTSKAGNAALPGDLIDLGYWYLTLPTGQEGSPDTIENPSLARFTNEFFKLNANRDGVVFSADGNGVTTKNSNYPRSELREMNGSQKASWSNTSGTHTLDVCEAITKVPAAKPHVVGAQIHGGDDDVLQIRLEGKTLMVQYNDGKSQAVLDPNYVLGTPYNVRIVAANSKVLVYYNGQQKADLPLSGNSWYWKVGAYVQSNSSKGDGAGSTGEVTVYSLNCAHTS